MDSLLQEVQRLSLQYAGFDLTQPKTLLTIALGLAVLAIVTRSVIRSLRDPNRKSRSPTVDEKWVACSTDIQACERLLAIDGTPNKIAGARYLEYAKRSAEVVARSTDGGGITRRAHADLDTAAWNAHMAHRLLKGELTTSHPNNLF